MKSFIKKYPHILWNLYIPIYIIGFILIEKFISTTNFFDTALPIDAYIPFWEIFVIPYCLWYPALFGIGIYLIFKDAPAFKRYMLSIIIGFSFSIIFCAIFPNGQSLRPDIFPRDNIFTQIIAGLYSADTNTNVLPSLHVVGAFAVQFAILDCEKLKKRWIYIISWIVTLLISLSTVFIKQHAILDVFAGIALSIVIYLIVYLPDKLKK